MKRLKVGGGEEVKGSGRVKRLKGGRVKRLKGGEVKRLKGK